MEGMKERKVLKFCVPIGLNVSLGYTYKDYLLKNNEF